MLFFFPGDCFDGGQLQRTFKKALLGDIPTIQSFFQENLINKEVTESFDNQSGHPNCLQEP